MNHCSQCGLESHRCPGQHGQSGEVERYLSAAQQGGTRVCPALTSLVGPYQALEWLGCNVREVFLNPRQF